MAIRCSAFYRGVSADYWRINAFYYDDVEDVATVSLWLYASREAAEASLKNALERVAIRIAGIKSMPLPQEVFFSDVRGPRDLLKKMLYLKIVESRLETRPVLAEDGLPTGDTIDVETNRFVNAEAC